MNEERDKIRCRQCELVQWSDRANCRRCGTSLPQPFVKVVERVVERVVVRQDAECIANLEQARELITLASERLTEQSVQHAVPVDLMQVVGKDAFPKMAEVERALILAAYQRSNRKSLVAARLLGIGKTTLYRKLREITKAAAH
jgi:transcriptional regulator of acetoin/glycerol metabolism